MGEHGAHRLSSALHPLPNSLPNAPACLNQSTCFYLPRLDPSPTPSLRSLVLGTARGYGLVTLRQVLGSRLPEYRGRKATYTPYESTTSAWRRKPDTVQPWETAEALVHGEAKPLDAAILSFQNEADDSDARQVLSSIDNAKIRAAGKPQGMFTAH